MTDVLRTPLQNILNMDQTNVRLVDPHKKTVSPLGLKEVIIRTSKGDGSMGRIAGRGAVLHLHLFTHVVSFR